MSETTLEALVNEEIRQLKNRLALAIEAINWAREHRNSMDFYEQLEIRLGKVVGK